LRLDRSFRWALYAAITILVITGCGWLLADTLKESEDWQNASAKLLAAHGGTAMITLMLLGALVPVHMLRAWRARKNRITGSCMATLNATLIATAFGLYYAGSDALRPWISDLHIAAGLCLPVLIIAHIWSGRRNR
jgi:hypothetical protein